MSQSSDVSSAADSQLDALISRIQSLSSDEGKAKPAAVPAEPQVRPPQQQPARPAAPGQQTQPRPTGPTRPQNGPPPATPQPPASRPPAPVVTEKPKPKAEGGPQQTVTSKIKIPDGPLGFKPSRDEVWRPVEPETIETAGVNETILEAIIYRYLQNIGEAEGRRISNQVKLPFRMVEPLLTRLKMEQNVAYKNATATNDYVYVLTETGRNIARNHINDCTYYGACPVMLNDYIKSISYQTIEGQYPKKSDLERAFSDLLINPNMLNKLGPAVASGRGIFCTSVTTIIP